MCCSAYSKNENVISQAFQTYELSITEYDIFKFFHTPSTVGTGNGNEDGGILYPACCTRLLDGWIISCAQPEVPQLKTPGMIHKIITQKNLTVLMIK
jgi:hypothetical protein